MSLMITDLRKVPILSDLEDSDLEWLIAHSQYQEFPAGASVVEQGSPADRMVIVLEGTIEIRFSKSTETIRIESGGITGLLPFSRLTHFMGMGVALSPIRILFIHKEDFMPMLGAIPALAPRLVGLLTDRVRSFSQQEIRQEKLASLGKLSAGLAHEMNNPASAAKRASAQLGEAYADLEIRSARVGELIGVTGLQKLLGYLDSLQPKPMSAMERSDLEDELGTWLEGHGAARAWEWAATWADAGVTVDWLVGLQPVKQELNNPLAMPHILDWLEATLRTRALVRVVEDSTERIAKLVGAIKSYSYMDQVPKQILDVREGLENTLAIFGYRLKQGIRILRDYHEIPKIEAHGSELNQVWTNLIDNALDAMGEAGTLTIRTTSENGQVLVEIGDTGPGIPAEIQSKIFDPFFTTKEVGKGTGLGLDMVRQIVQRHQGSIQVESRPGDTRFQVRLPIR
ncbi:MAG: ATP-binding protein [Meiothermus sp.]|nr:ATP-binding protein [Meiothermus sp.]